MAHISRPFQIALVAIVLLGGVWLFALHGSSKAPEPSSSAAPSVPAQVPATPSGASAQGGAASPGSAAAPVYHGSAPGVAGLTAAVAKAQGAVATSQQNAKQLEQKSAQASSPQAQSSPAPASGASAVGATPAPRVSSSKVGSSKAPAAPTGGTHSKYQLGSSVLRQKSVEASLKAGNVVLVLFWDSKGTDDLAVLNAVRSFEHGHGKVVVQTAKASEVASFGSITRGVQVYGTPTVLVVGKRAQVTVLTGLTDAYSLEQAIAEARHR